MTPCQSQAPWATEQEGRHLQPEGQGPLTPVKLRGLYCLPISGPLARAPSLSCVPPPALSHTVPTKDSQDNNLPMFRLVLSVWLPLGRSWRGALAAAVHAVVLHEKARRALQGVPPRVPQLNSLPPPPFPAPRGPSAEAGKGYREHRQPQLRGLLVFPRQSHTTRGATVRTRQ